MFGKSPHLGCAEKRGHTYDFDENRRTSRVSCVTAMRQRDDAAIQAVDLDATTRSSQRSDIKHPVFTIVSVIDYQNPSRDARSCAHRGLLAAPHTRAVDRGNLGRDPT